jgi:uncharacterized repeat protein (TIGR01451 family)
MQPISSPVKSRRRVLALILSFGALILLLVATAMTTQAYVTSKMHDTLADFVEGRFYWTGLLDIPPDVQSVQLMPAGLVTHWAVDRPLPVALKELAAVAVEDYIVVMGGYDDSDYRDEVYVSAIGADGSLGAWQEQTAYPLPNSNGIAGAAAVTQPKDQNSSWIYLIGGFDGTQALSTVYQTTLDHTTGTIGDWTATEPLSVPVAYLDAVALDGYVYAVGGQLTMFPFGSTDGVYYAQIQGDGSLGAWQTTELLPEALHYHLVVGYSDETVSTLYTIGGRNEPAGVSSLYVFFSNANPDGSLAPWAPLPSAGWSFGNLPKPLYAHSGDYLNGAILATGGVETQGVGNDQEVNIVKAALIDPGEPNFQLYNWCGTTPWPICTIGAWETGEELLQKRTFHVTVATSRYVYTLGGVSGGNAIAAVSRGSIDEESKSAYAPHGYYISPEFDVEGYDVQRLSWHVTMGHPDDQSIELIYRYRRPGGTWSAWSTPAIDSSEGENILDFTPPITDVRFFQYRVDLTTNVTDASPLLDWVEIFYEVPDPELSISKDTGGIITATSNNALQYTIHYTNNGGWVAEGVVLTETLPDNTIFSGGDPGWQQVGTSNQYTLVVSDVLRNATGSAIFEVFVQNPPPTERRITNTVEIDYAPMTDAFGQVIVDPKPENNHYEFSNPLKVYVIEIDKEAAPPAGSIVKAGTKITYTISYSNVGLIEADPAIINDTLSPDTGYTLVSVNPPFNNGDYSWDLGTLNPGEGGTIEFVVELDAAHYDAPWYLTNIASLSSPQGPVEDSLMLTHTITNNPGLYIINIDKVADPPSGTTLEPGSRITYTINYTNEGQIPADPAIVSDTISPTVNFSLVSANPPFNNGDYSWDLGTLNPGEKGTIEFVIQIDDIEYPEPWELTNRAFLDSPQGPPKYTTMVTHLIEMLKIKLTKEADPPAGTLLEPGDQVRYTITYSNYGHIEADPAIVSDTITPHTELSVISSNPAFNNGDYSWDLGTLSPGEKGSLEFVVQIASDTIFPGDAQLANYASFGSLQGWVTDSISVTHPIASPLTDTADLVVESIRWTPTKPYANSTVKFYVTIANRGELDAVDPFWVELYVKPSPSKAPLRAGDHDYGYCLNGCSTTRSDFVQKIAHLPAGDSLEVPFDGPQLAFSPAGTYDVYAQVDVSWDPPGRPTYHPYWGYYIESKESNNVKAKKGMIVKDWGPDDNCPGICLPLIFKKGP